MRVKLIQILDLVDKHGVQIIALQETKLREYSFLKVHIYSVYRMDRPSESGGGLVLLIRNLNFNKIVFPVQDSNLELGNIKRFRPFVRLKDSSLATLFAKRDLLRQELATSNDIADKIKLRKLNAEIKQQYITQKRESWKTICSSIYARAPNSKLWRFAKSFSNDQPQVKDNNIVLDS
ncbi:hypothetical protein TNCT_739071 [Trichonephila clavata]|uniref:Uncharacterized protein n=1 Tax=Trichonephila clavata TaxID=2740835 RepID=A0A8X6LM29_TRICU|nr:hypothetical protein TNCT_739071 [Trichonephila clavata]